MSYSRYVAGERAGPPEDGSGLPGFYHALDALADRKHPDHAEVADCLDKYDFDRIDELPLKIALGRLASRHNAARTRLAGKTA